MENIYENPYNEITLLQKGRSILIVKFYSRPNCELCEEGLLTLKMVQEDLAFQIEHYNIETSDNLHEKYMFMIPVVEVNNEVIQYGHLDYATLLEALTV